MKKVLIVGSMSHDFTYRIDQHPKEGETIRVKEVREDFGGKGANQAVAASRAGSKVVMVGAVGKDVSGDKIVERMEREGICMDYVQRLSIQTGVAQIILADDGENIIYIIPGANRAFAVDEGFLPEDLLEETGFVLFQNEIEMDVNLKLMKAFSHRGMKVVWDPAPYEKFPLEALAYVDYLLPNEMELKQLVPHLDGDLERAEYLLQYGVKNVLVTLGAKGSLHVGEEGVFQTSAPQVDVVDTVAAGDTFAGYFVSFLNEGYPLQKAISLAHKAGSLAVTRKGSQKSIPYRKELI